MSIKFKILFKTLAYVLLIILFSSNYASANYWYFPEYMNQNDENPWCIVRCFQDEGGQNSRRFVIVRRNFLIQYVADFYNPLSRDRTTRQMVRQPRLNYPGAHLRHEIQNAMFPLMPNENILGDDTPLFDNAESEYNEALEYLFAGLFALPADGINIWDIHNQQAPFRGPQQTIDFTFPAANTGAVLGTNFDLLVDIIPIGELGQVVDVQQLQRRPDLAVSDMIQQAMRQNGIGDTRQDLSSEAFIAHLGSIDNNIQRSTGDLDLLFLSLLTHGDQISRLIRWVRGESVYEDDRKPAAKRKRKYDEL